MWVSGIRLMGIRCFEDSGQISLSPGCNVFVGQNNSGKSTILKSITSWQGFGFIGADRRPGSTIFRQEIYLEDLKVGDNVAFGFEPGNLKVIRDLSDRNSSSTVVTEKNTFTISGDLFVGKRPHHAVVPFSAKRKANGFDQNVNLESQSTVNGTLSNLYSRIDLLATSGHPRHESFKEAVNSIVGIPITTKASVNGKEAGFYFDIDNFVTLDRMGDGVSEMVALIVELCLEDGKIFVLEEPETNLHPKGLKSLLNLLRKSSERNQFIIATHSNIVLREIGSQENAKVFRTSKQGDIYQSPSLIEEVEKNTISHMELLRELGYEFADLDLHDGWLFLEESSAETIFRNILIPIFYPKLSNRVRTFSSRGATNLTSSIVEFRRLVSFVHLQPAYEGRIWIRADGDAAGKEAIEAIRRTFSSLGDHEVAAFSEENFEKYYPKKFESEVLAAISIENKKRRGEEKLKLLKLVLDWTASSPKEAAVAWAESAAEPIKLLKEINTKIGS